MHNLQILTSKGFALLCGSLLPIDVGSSHLGHSKTSSTGAQIVDTDAPSQGMSPAAFATLPRLTGRLLATDAAAGRSMGDKRRRRRRRSHLRICHDADPEALRRLQGNVMEPKRLRMELLLWLLLVLLFLFMRVVLLFCVCGRTWPLKTAPQRRLASNRTRAERGRVLGHRRRLCGTRKRKAQARVRVQAQAVRHRRRRAGHGASVQC